MNDKSVQKMFFEDLVFTGLQFLGQLEATGALPCQYEHYNILSSYYFLLGLSINHKCSFMKYIYYIVRVNPSLCLSAIFRMPIYIVYTGKWFESDKMFIDIYTDNLVFF